MWKKYSNAYIYVKHCKIRQNYVGQDSKLFIFHAHSYADSKKLKDVKSVMFSTSEWSLMLDLSEAESPYTGSPYRWKYLYSSSNSSTEERGQKKTLLEGLYILIGRPATPAPPTIRSVVRRGIYIL